MQAYTLRQVLFGGLYWTALFDDMVHELEE